MTNKETNRSYDLVEDTEAAYVDKGIVVTSGPKRGHSFCGCCCDVRRATIIFNIIGIVSVLYTLVWMEFMKSEAFVSVIQDDQVKNSIKSIPPPSVVTMVCVAAGLGFSISAIVGAVTYNALLVLGNVIWLIFGFVSTAFFAAHSEVSAGFSAYLALSRCFVLYPQVVLWYELKVTQTMSKQTYKPREEQSCCCVSNKYY